MEATVAEDVGKPGALGLGEHDVYIVRTRQAKIPPCCCRQLGCRLDQFSLGPVPCPQVSPVELSQISILPFPLHDASRLNVRADYDFILFTISGAVSCAT
jgi:hypothetical protein